jgi:hypothetical protein
MSKVIEWVHGIERPHVKVSVAYGVELSPTVPEGKLVVKKPGKAQLELVGKAYRFHIVEEPLLEFIPLGKEEETLSSDGILEAPTGPEA